MRTADLDYDLPRELIAVKPARPRDSARMLVVRRSGGEIEHRHVRDLPEYLRRGDVMVFNNTAVAPARIRAVRVDTGGGVDGLVLDPAGDDSWVMMLRSNGRLREGVVLELLDRRGERRRDRITLTGREGAVWLGRVAGDVPCDRVLDDVGLTPLPPYILKARGDAGDAIADDDDRAWYQTVYADHARRRSVAAPTAGLHFTPQLLERIDAQGVERLAVTLHIGPGTFKPIETETVESHRMHSETYEVDPNVLRRAIAARQAGGRLIAVGTTSVRTLESIAPAPAPGGAEQASGPIVGTTDLLITPPFDRGFHWVDGLLTNFHLPRSTLLALVAAFIGLDRLKAVYGEAVRQRYRFYSYGDAMLILP